MSLRLSHDEIEQAVVEHLERRGFVVSQGVQDVLLEADDQGNVEAHVNIETPAARLPRAEG